MKKKALIIFLKYPELGRAKTRLAKDIGQENALKVYMALLDHTHQVSKYLKFNKFLFYDKVSPNKLNWGHDYHTSFQVESDLGGRIKNAFEQLFDKSYEEVVIIGSDCYELTQETIESAFKLLIEHEVVIGPAKDGGYYLLGLKRLIPQLFQHIEWSTENVFSDTVKMLNHLEIKYATTPVLSDIDTIEDLPQNLKSLIM